jgi:hypothetical protein
MEKWLTRMGPGPLRLFAEKITTKICAYQKERYSRLIGRGSLDDPTSLVLEEFKEWITTQIPNHFYPLHFAKSSLSIDFSIFS